MKERGYEFIKLVDFIGQISDLMDDPGQRYWTYDEIQGAVYEGMLLWGGTTNYWRTRGTFDVGPAPVLFSGVNPPSPYIDLSVKLPSLRARTFTLDRMVREIQFMLLEASNGISGAGMSGQLSVSGIITAIQDARNRFVRDVHYPLYRHFPLSPSPSADGRVEYPDNSVFVHRAAWRDIEGAWTILWRQDSWAVDRSDPGWTLNPGVPTVYSESDSAPLQMQLIPAPIRQGGMEALTVDIVMLDPASGGATLQIPDEWAHVVKYAALSQILSSAGQISDPLRAQYCESRYAQGVEFAQKASSIIRALVNNVPLPLADISSVDLSYPYWMNAVGKPFVGSVLYDWLVLCPGVMDRIYGVGVDLVQSAIIPDRNDYIQMGEEELDNLKDYVQHILPFKCGGRDFTSTIGGYDTFMKAVEDRKAITAARVLYMEPLFNQPQRESSMRPDEVKSNG